MAKHKIVELARKAVKGDLYAFEQICREKQRDMMFVAQTILGNYEDAEDAVQEAIILMHKNIQQLRAANAVGVWIERIVRNESFKIYNARIRKNDDVDIDDESVIAYEDNREFLPEAYAEDTALSERLYQQILSLAPAKRDVIIMYYYEGLTYKEIAKVTGISMKSVSSNLTKARMMLKKKLLQEDQNQKARFGIGVPATSTVIGRSLKLHSEDCLPDEKMDALEEKWMLQVQTIPMAAAAKSLAVKSLVGVVAKTAVVAAVAVPIIFYGISVMPRTAGPGGREIVFTGDDCDCGHINPQSFEIAHSIEGDGAPVWDIRSADDGTLIFTGNSASAAAGMDDLIAKNQDAKYTLTCTLINAEGGKVHLERDFAIGNFSGDA